MSTTIVPVMVNTEPFHFEAQFNKPYSQVTANDVLKKAAEFLEDYSNSPGHGGRVRLPEDLRDALSLRYIIKLEDAFALSSAPSPGSPITEEFPGPYTRLAAEWYESTGCSLSSIPVDGRSRLESTALPDATRVRWYILLSVSVKPLPYFMHPSLPVTILDIVSTRESYIAQVADSVNNRKTTGLASPSQLGDNPSLLTPEQKEHTPIATGNCPASDWGTHPAIFVPIFANAYNYLWNSQHVQLERATSPDEFDIIRWLDVLVAVCLTQYEDERKFNLAVIAELRKLFPFLKMEPHVEFKDENKNRAIEVDMLGTCYTAHGHKAAPILVEGKKRVGKGGDPIVQVFNACQRMLALDHQFAGTIASTCCPAVMMSVTGYIVRVYLMYFADKIYGAHFFTLDLSPSTFGTSLNEMTDLANKFQILRNTVKELCDFYANVHTGTISSAVPYLFPQPVSLLKSLVPPPDPELLRRLSSMKLVLIEYLHSVQDPGRCLFKALSFETGAATIVYVKFVMAVYGEAAHRLLAAQDPPLAPRLLWCGEIIFGKTMVVMEAIPAPRHSKDPHPRKYNEEDIAIVERDIRRALDVLQSHDLVHGDVRQSNIVIARQHAYLIDFDMAGKAGVARYPAGLNGRVWWPGEIKDLRRMPIETAHDNLRFERTLGELHGDFDHEETSSPSKRTMGEDGGDQRPIKRLRSDETSIVLKDLTEVFGGFGVGVVA